jgi:hypothetical protein
VQRLPGPDIIEPGPPKSSERYDHVSPWESPALLDDRLELDQGSDVDPDDVDPESWADELDGKARAPHP